MMTHALPFDVAPCSTHGAFFVGTDFLHSSRLPLLDQSIYPPTGLSHRL